MRERFLPELWTARQRTALCAIVAVLLLIALARYAMNRREISDPQPTVGARAGELDGRIDPNTADAATLASIPGFGEKRAQAVVEYREQALAQRPSRLPFQRVEDLQGIRGIGPATLETLKLYLTFRSTQSTAPTSTTRP